MLTELDQQNAHSKNTIDTRYPAAKKLTLALILSCAGISAANADDTEIFTAGVAPPPDSSNVVFMIDTSGSMNNPIQGDDSGTAKIQVVKDVFERLIFETNSSVNRANPAMQGLKMALMRFDNGENNDGNANGGYFIHEMRTLNNGSVGDFWTVINGLSAGGYTPLAETAFEAARFFKGETPHFTNTTPGTNVSGVLAGGRYKSPFSNGSQSQCGINNHLVILTDGLPTRDGDADTLINALPNTTANCVFSEASNTDCLPQMAEHLYAGDLLPNMDGEQKVMTHTIAFDLRSDSAAVGLLRQTAENGGGLATNANNAEELAQAIERILAEIPDSAVSMVSPAVSVDGLNQFVHDNTVYIGMFKPEMSPLWPGNLKGYQYSADGILQDFSSTPVPALNGDAFADNARSKWSSAIDAGNVDQGGAAEQILAQPGRNIFTQNSSTPSGQELVRFSVANETQLQASDFGDNISNDQKIEIIQWATSRSELPIGDPLHSQPIMIDFGGDIGSVIFFGTNQGFLHAISASTGRELMAFIPKSLLSNLRVFRDNNSQNDHPYGLDGHISYYRHDANGDGRISAVDNDKVLVIVGMRRGGNEFFALDVTNLSSPSQAWHITGGGTGVFADLGDSWSKPIITEMKFGNSSNPTRQRVALIAGGYDNQYDELSNTITNPVGAALFAINLETGACEWSASDSASGCTRHTAISTMTDSIPSHIAAIDLTSDNVVDRIYAIDVLGRIFRVDFNFTDADGNYVINGQLFADLSGGTRRYYYGVDVAYTKSNFTDKLHLSVGSGHRAHPLADSSDIAASVWDLDVFNPLPSGFSALTMTSLSDLTNLDATIAAESRGWYFNLGSGEKILSIASSLAGYVFLTSYSPPGANDTPANPCQVQYGSGNVYAVSLANASPLDPDNPQANGRSIAISSTGISSGVAFMTLNRPSGSSSTNISNPLASQDTQVFAMVNGKKLLFTELAQEIINSSAEATKSYWFIGEPQ